MLTAATEHVMNFAQRKYYLRIAVLMKTVLTYFTIIVSYILGFV